MGGRALLPLLPLLLLGAPARQVLALPAACNSSRSCSLNGDCVSGACQCDQGWVGSFCQQLDLLPVVNATGLDRLHGAARTSTWGGTILRDNSSGIDVWHMWASEMLEHCGIHRWTGNSVVVHATADRPDGTYTRQEVVFGHFSHEPTAARSPTGEFVLYFTHNSHMNTSNPVGKCADGSSDSAAAGHANGNCNWGRDTKLPLLKSCTMWTYMSFATDPAGPWSTPVPIPSMQPNPYFDTNFSPIIEEDGSLLGWTRKGIVRAKDWRNVSSYRLMGTPFADKSFDKTWGEDPFLWKDKRRGGYHILSHGTNTGDDTGLSQPRDAAAAASDPPTCTPGSTVRGCQPGPEGDCGRHFFSTSGGVGTWAAAPLPREENGGCSYWRMAVPFADGHRRTFWCRERPHLAIEADGTISALTTGTMDTPVFDNAHASDATYTMLQRVARRAAAAAAELMPRQR